MMHFGNGDKWNMTGMENSTPLLNALTNNK